MSFLGVEISRFACVGFFATIIHVGVAYLVHTLGAVDLLYANGFGFAAAVLVTYTVNFYWTFSGRSRHSQSGGRFIVLASASLACSSLIVFVTAKLLAWPFTVSLLSVAAIVPSLSFLLSKFWVFRRPAEGERWSDPDLPLLIAGVCLSAWFYSGTMINHDTSWYLIATARWLDGARLYKDIMEINPPLAFFLTAPAVVLARRTPLSPETAFVAITFAEILVSLLWTSGLLRRSGHVAAGRRTILTAGAFAALCLAPIGDFGQREHLMVIFALPYIVLCAFRPATPAAERVAIGGFAVLGLALKPHFLLLPSFVAVLSIVRQRRAIAAITPEHLTIGVGCAAYAVLMAVLYPDYFLTVVPAARLVYAAYVIPPLVVLLVPAFLAVGALTALLMTSSGWTEDEREISVTLLAVVLAFVVAYVAQFKGWPYQRIPIYSALCFAGAWIVPVASKYAARRQKVAIAPAMLAGTYIAVVFTQILGGPYRNAVPELFGDILRREEAGRSFLALTNIVSFSFPLANITNADVVSRYPTLWLIPGAVVQLRQKESLPEDRRRKLMRLLEYARQTTTDDFVRGRPDVVFVDVRAEKPYFGTVSFDYVAFFAQDERFREAWRNYRLTDIRAGFEVWERF